MAMAHGTKANGEELGAGQHFASGTTAAESQRGTRATRRTTPQTRAPRVVIPALTSPSWRACNPEEPRREATTSNGGRPRITFSSIPVQTITDHAGGLNNYSKWDTRGENTKRHEDTAEGIEGKVNFQFQGADTGQKAVRDSPAIEQAIGVHGAPLDEVKRYLTVGVARLRVARRPQQETSTAIGTAVGGNFYWLCAGFRRGGRARKPRPKVMAEATNVDVNATTRSDVPTVIMSKDVMNVANTDTEFLVMDPQAVVKMLRYATARNSYGASGE